MALMDAHFERRIEVIATAVAGLEADQGRRARHLSSSISGFLTERPRIDPEPRRGLGADKPFILMTGYGSGALDEAALRRRAPPTTSKSISSAPISNAPSATHCAIGRRAARSTIVKNNCASRRRWKRSDVWPEASRTTSTTC
jgi:hypothetical protein